MMIWMPRSLQETKEGETVKESAVPLPAIYSRPPIDNSVLSCWYARGKGPRQQKQTETLKSN